MRIPTALAAGLCCLFLASAALAQAGRVPDVWNWKAYPHRPDIAAVAPPEPPGHEGEGGAADLLCVLTPARGLSLCRVVLETPTGGGYGAAALALAPLWREPAGEFADLPAGGPVIVSAIFPSPTQMITRPYFMGVDREHSKLGEWAFEPSLKEIARAAPGEVAGPSHAVLDCEIAAGGDLTACRFAKLQPSGRCSRGAGVVEPCNAEDVKRNAATDPAFLLVAPLLRAPAAAPDGSPSIGHTVRFFVDLAPTKAQPLPLVPPPSARSAAPRRGPTTMRPTAHPWNPLGALGTP